MAKMLAIRLPETIEKRLETLAKKTGRTKTYYAREAILRHLDDLEDTYAAEAVLERIRRGEEHTTALDEVMKEIGISKGRLAGRAVRHGKKTAPRTR
jgi:RHH-type transcriptional regulator, rel operon repressor / antitoxin RelB